MFAYVSCAAGDGRRGGAGNSRAARDLCFNMVAPRVSYLKTTRLGIPYSIALPLKNTPESHHWVRGDGSHLGIHPGMGKLFDREGR
ncbi:hypothetical protein ABZ695_24065 [Streptomyces sp. NPDC006976]|uniref:hypothetical protein n=1 Tax=Streptomyces sp. NPDC006976 TaxID=3154311 RepID=UPI0010AF5C68|nr:hypothetical protein [Streptomyces sp.]